MAKNKAKNIFKNLLLLIIVLAIVTMLLEISLRLAYPFYFNYNTEMWRYSVLLKRASPNPNVSHEHVPNSEAFLYGVDVKINSYGFRDKEYSLKKPENTYRILVLGDSFTLGWGVPIKDVYSEVLEKMLNENIKGKKFEVINTALGNYNTQMEYEFLKEKGLKLNPDMVIVGFYPNDPELTVKFDEKSISTFIKRHSYIYAFFWDRIVKLKTRIELARNKRSYTGYVHNLYRSDFEGRKIMEISLNGIIDLSKQNSITPVVVILPQFFGNFENYEFKEVYPTVSSITSRKNALTIDILPYFKNNSVKDVIVSFEDAHPNKLGHSIIAKAIYDNIYNIVSKKSK